MSFAFKPRHILFPYRGLDIIGVIDRESGEIVRAWGPGVVDGQHRLAVIDLDSVLTP